MWEGLHGEGTAINPVWILFCLSGREDGTLTDLAVSGAYPAANQSIHDILEF